MEISTLSGHLTTTNKTHIKAILKANLTEAKVNTTNYCLRLNDGVYTVKIAKKDRGLGFIGNELRVSIYNATFKIL